MSPTTGCTTSPASLRNNLRISALSQQVTTLIGNLPVQTSASTLYCFGSGDVSESVCTLEVLVNLVRVYSTY